MLLIIALLLSIVGLFLSLWIIVPAPKLFLLPLGVVAPEISPWLVCLNACALTLIITNFSPKSFWWVGLIFSLFALFLSLLPLFQLPATEKKLASEMASTLGANYLNEISPAQQGQMRPRPFILGDVFRGIPLPEVRIQRGIIFASPDGQELKLNTYLPLTRGKYPTLIVIYSGAWRQGNPDKNESFSRYFASQGYSVIAIDYRHAPQYRFPTQLEDVQTALHYIISHAEELEVDTERLAIMGRSAGAHLAMLAGYQSDNISFKAIVNYYGPVNLSRSYHNTPFPNPLNTRAVLRDFLGGSQEELSALYEQASPINKVKPKLPPSLLVYAQRDHLVQAKIGRELYDLMQAQNNLAVWLEIPWAEHVFDEVFSGVSNQLILYHTERFLAWTLGR
ncbi:MAG: alpha/beta hydrolase fold domain-containing protein [Crocosphaera sp.]